MTTTTQAPAPAGTEISTQLASLSTIVNQNTDLAARAEMSVRPEIDKFKIIDFAAIDPVSKTPLISPESLTIFDSTINALMIKCKDSEEINLKRRTPLTQKFDAIRTLFTTQEKRIAGLSDELKAIRVRIASEINRRQKIEDDKRLKEHVKITFKQFVSDRINAGYIVFLTAALVRMREKFMSCANVTELYAYVDALKGFQFALQALPAYNISDSYNVPSIFLLTEDERKVIVTAAESEMFPVLSASYVQALVAERQKLIDEAPARDFSILLTPPAFEEIQETIAMESHSITQHVESTAIAATFTTVATMAPVVTQAAGTKTKKKYQANTHQAHVALLQWYVANCMHLLSLEDLTTKFSFVRTAANKSLNEGSPVIVAAGLEVVDDINTRVKR